MQLKLIYHFLRKISDWTVSGYYSEVYVEGEENVPSQGPLIVASTHHNEIMDIATLAATIPHRHHLSFWAKSNMFVNPLIRIIMESSGAIPVYRIPNSRHDTLNTSSHSLDGSGIKNNASDTRASLRANLFRDTFRVLDRGEVIGVFPEGTSYTEPEIVQVLPGAARAAVEYVRWAHSQGDESKEHRRTGLKIIPVGIVYTDKSRYLSRVYVRYGKPIEVYEYVNETLVSDATEELISSTVTRITEEIGRKLKEMTINAPDWKTLFVVRMARTMLWGDDTKIVLNDWVPVSQVLIQTLLSDVAQLESVKSALTRYYALLHYTGIDHITLEAILPWTSRTSLKTLLMPSVYMPYYVLLTAIRLVLFAPVLTVYGPAYLAGRIGGYLAPKDEESQAQFKGIFGGLGLGSTFALMSRLLWRKEAIVERFLSSQSEMKRTLVALAFGYASFVVTIKWHNVFVSSNYNTLRRIVTFGKVFMGLILPSSEDVSAYIRPPLPRRNPFVKRTSESSFNAGVNAPVGSIASWKLIRHLLIARENAHRSLNSYFQIADPEAVSFLEHKGAVVIRD